jgi:hypothetical protein
MGGRTNGSSKGNSYEGQKSKDGELHVCGLEVRDLELKGDKKGRPATEVYKKIWKLEVGNGKSVYQMRDEMGGDQDQDKMGEGG